jgi:hypothetical protein
VLVSKYRLHEGAFTAKLPRMQPSDLHNPYAPPQDDIVPAYAPLAGTPYRSAIDVTEALRRLREHVAHPHTLDADRLAAGPRVRRAGWILVAVGGVAGVLAATFGASAGTDLVLALLIVPVILVFVGVLLMAVDLGLAPRDKPSAPDKTLRSFLKAIAMARFGYAFTCLCPTAREQTVVSPDLRPVETVPGLIFPLRGEADVKAYMNSFARTSGKVMRLMAVKRPVIASIEGDVARVNVELRFQSWPRWVWIVAVVGFIILRPLFIVGAVAYFITRKRRTVHVSKTMLRAPNGVWYVCDGDVLEGQAA